MIRIYGLRERLDPIKRPLSDLINACMVDALRFPPDKRAHRFFPMEREDFFYPEGRSDAYLVIEIHLMEGRSVDARKRLIHALFQSIATQLGVQPLDVEITICETPPCNWGFRGTTGDEAILDYSVKV